MDSISNIGTSLEEASKNLKKMFIALMIFSFIVAIAILITSLKNNN